MLNPTLEIVDSAFDALQEENLMTFLHSRVGEEKFKPGLQRLLKMTAPFKSYLEQEKIFIAIIGGTNGKGETSHSLAQLCYQHGYSYALWTSPHVLSVRERFQFNHQLVSYELLQQAIDSCYERCCELVRQKEIEALPTFYELMFMVFLQLLVNYHQQKKIDICLLEVGLGGRLDGVNIFDADVTAITSISRDHENILGRGYKNILKEKLGITRGGVPLFTNLELTYCREIVEKECEEKKFPWVDFFQQQQLCKQDDYSTRNKVLALALFYYFKGTLGQNLQQHLSFLRDHCLKDELRQFHFQVTKGRNDSMTRKERRFIFMGSHNIDGIRKLKACADHFDYALLSFSKRSLTEIKNVLKILQVGSPIARKIVVTAFQHERAIPWSELAPLTLDEELSDIYFIEHWNDFVESEETIHQTILVAGSYYFVGRVQAELLSHS